MDKFIIEGPTPLKGEIAISGSKNAALPIMAASLLADSPARISNIPVLNDILTFNNVLRVTGARVDFDKAEHQLTIHPENITHLEAPYDLVRKMRASFYMLGSLLGKFGKAKVSLPGGCAWGPRPVNLHLEGLKALGAEIEIEGGYVFANAPGGKLAGGTYELKPSSVGATVNLLLAAVLANGTSEIKNAAKEPDVITLCECLNKMGARISGVGTRTLTVEGVDRLEGTDLSNIPDRIEAGTFIVAGMMHPDSEITLTGVDPNHLGGFLESVESLDPAISIENDTIKLSAPDKLQSCSIETQVYPGFPTDLQAQWATLMTQAEGNSNITDTIYPDRFSYIPELNRLGADMELSHNTARIKGPTPLTGASVMSTDLRASVSLVMAGMIASGSTEVLRVYHLDRGYENLEEKLNKLGAKISREPAETNY